MSLAAGPALWSSPEWHERAQAWLDARLAAAGIERTGALEQPRVRPWATVLSAPTSAGLVWLKAAGPANAFEAGLYRLLESVAPEHVLEPIALDVERGWMLLPDGGPPLAERLSGRELVETLASVLPQYGQLQRDLAPHADDLLALGIADMRPAIMPQRFEEALTAVRSYVARRSDPQERDTLRRVGAMRGQVSAWCDELAAAPAGPSLDHNDLHPWNVLAGPDGTFGQARFYDWGDGVVAHPFASILVALAIGVEASDVDRLQAAYLEPFTDLAPQRELLRTLELACRVGKIARSLTWQHAVTAVPGGESDEEWAQAPLASLGALLDASHLGGA